MQNRRRRKTGYLTDGRYRQLSLPRFVFSAPDSPGPTHSEFSLFSAVIKMAGHPGALRPVLSLMLLALLLIPISVFAASARNKTSLWFIELQAVGAWSLSEGSFQTYSYLPHHQMQKNGAGLEFLTRLYRGNTDLGYISFQTRLVYDEHGESPLSFHLYNAFLRLKTRVTDFWLGHGKPALGLNYTFDNHAVLFPDATMLGHNLDRDWGGGLHHDFQNGDLAVSLTSGSGQALKFGKNYLLSGRVSYGVLARDNYSLSLSVFTGRVIDEMAPESDPVSWSGVAADISYLWLWWENRLEINLGRRSGQPWHLVLWRPGVNLLQEQRLKVEAQLALLKHGPDWSYSTGAGLSYRLNSDLTFRTLLLYDRQQRNFRLVGQLYYYRNVN